jgi:hypothetical protein
MTSRNDSSNPNMSLTDGDNTPDCLLDIVKYLKREKDVLNGKVKVVEAESSRLKLELETTRRELVQHSTSLEAAAERAQIENALPSIKFKNLQVIHLTITSVFITEYAAECNQCNLYPTNKKSISNTY